MTPPGLRNSLLAAFAAGLLTGHAQTNDNFEGRIPITGNGGFSTSDSLNATREIGEPYHAGATGGKSLWWTWTAPATGVANFSTFGSAGTGISDPEDLPPAALAVYTGDSLATLSETGSSNHQTFFSAETFGTEATGQSFNMPVVAGTTYQIAIDSPGWANDSTTVLNVNQPPTIVSNAIATGNLGASFIYTIQASNTPSSYDAPGLPAGLSINPASGVISGIPLATGTFPVAVTATGCGGTGSAVVTFIIDPAADTSSSLPVIHGAATSSTTIGASYSYGIDADHSPISYAATGLPPGLALDISSGMISGSPTVAGHYPVTISATNAAGTSAAAIELLVAALPSPPIITSSATPRGGVSTSFYYTITTDSQTAPAAANSFTASNLPPGLGLDRNTGTISGSPTTAGVYTVPISATNAGGTGTATLTISIAAASSPAGQLLITSSATAAGKVGTPFFYAVATQGNPTSYSASGLPDGLSLNSANGYVTGTPMVAGIYSINLSVGDGNTTVGGVLTLTVSSSVASDHTNLPPIIGSSASVICDLNKSFSYQPTYESGSGSPFGSVTYAAVGLPAGLAINSMTGAITGTPSRSGTFSVAVTATTPPSLFSASPVSVTGHATITFIVRPVVPAPTSPPVITNSLNASGLVSKPFTYTVAATGTPTSFDASGLPDGLSVNTSTGAISGSPTVAGVFTPTLSATNAQGTGTARITMTIAATPAVPTITSSAFASGVLSSSFYYSITGSNNPTSFATGDLPPGLQLNSTSGAISGTPSAVGTYSIPVSASNASGTGTATLTMTVGAISAPVIGGAAGASGAVGTPFTYFIDGSNTPTTYTADSLPPGLSLNSASGLISGSPTTAGTYTVPVTATNTGGVGIGTITMIITPGQLPIITSPAEASGLEGTSFLYSISATNSSFTFNTFGLPFGLSLNPTSGVISGTPSAANSSIGISATNAAGTTSCWLRMVIPTSSGSVTPIVTSSAEATGFTGIAFAYQVKASGQATHFSLVSALPSGLFLDPNTGLIYGTPTAAQTVTTIITATTALKVSSSASITFVIATRPKEVPTITCSAGVTGALKEPFYFPVTATNAPTSTTTFSPLPAGLTLNSMTGIISGVPTQSGTFPLTIIVGNSIGLSKAVVQLVISNEAPPAITSSAAVGAIVGTSFSYTIATDHIPHSFSASGLPIGLTCSVSTGVISGTISTPGTYTVNLGVDTEAGAAAGTLTILATAGQSSTPVISSKAGANADISDPFFYAITASNSPTAFSATSLPAGLILNPQTGVIFGIPVSAGVFTIPITAGAGTASLTLKVSGGALEPAVSSIAQPVGYLGSPFSYTFAANGQILAFGQGSAMPPGLTFNNRTGEIRGTPTVAGTYPLTISYDEKSGFSNGTVYLVIYPTPVSVPVITSSAEAPAYVGTDFKYTITASSVPTTFGAKNLPPGLALNPATGVITGQPVTSGNRQFTITAANLMGTGSATLTLQVGPTPPMPVLTSNAMAETHVGATGVAYTITATNSPKHFTASGLPPGLTVDSASGAISGTALAAGTYSVSISASNTGGSVQTTLIFVVDAPTAPIVESPAGAVALVGRSFHYYLGTTDGADSFDASGLPDGLSIDRDTGEISGSATMAGTYPILLSATKDGLIGTATLTLVVAPPAGNGPAINEGAASALGLIGESFNYYFSASAYLNGIEFPVIYAASGLPPGLAIDTTTGTIAGTPTSAGSYSTTLSATNAVGTSSVDVLVQIVTNTASVPVLTNAAGTVGFVGAPLHFWIAIGDSLPTTYRADNLPPGLTLDPSTGLISGSPTAAGDYSCGISATNSEGVANGTVRLLVLATPDTVPTITSAAAAAFPDGNGLFFDPYFEFAGAAPSFSYTIQATNGATVFSATNLPTGLSLNPSTGVISGVPAATGTFVIPISATNAAGTGNAVLTIEAYGSATSFTSSADVAGTIGQPLSASVAPEFFAEFTSYFPITTFSASGLPPGLSLNSATGSITGVPSSTGSFPATINATSSAGTARETVTFLLGQADLPPAAPLFASGTAAATAALDTPFSYHVSTTGVPSEFFAENLPPGLGLSVQSAVINGVPTSYAIISGTPTSAGTFAVPITAKSEYGSSGMVATISVTSTRPEPAIVSSAFASAQEGAAFAYFIRVGYDAAISDLPVAYTATGLPDGLVVNRDTGEISGTPTTKGLFSTALSATVAGKTATATLTISIPAVFAPLPRPTVTAPAGAIGFVGLPFHEAVTAANAPDLAITSLPDGLTFLSATATQPAMIAGIPTTAGSFALPLAATNADSTTSGILTITISAAQSALPTIVSQPADQAVVVDTDATLSVTATGTPDPTYQWLLGTTVLDGATGSTLVLPTVGHSSEGDYSVVVTNPSGSVTSRVAHLTVTPLPTPTPTPTPTASPAPTPTGTPPPDSTNGPKNGTGEANDPPLPPKSISQTILYSNGFKVVLTGKVDASNIVEYRIGTSGKFRKATGGKNWRIVAALHHGSNLFYIRSVNRTTGSASKLKRITVSLP